MSVRIRNQAFHLGGGVEALASSGQVRHDEAGGPDVVKLPTQGQGALVGGDGAPPPRAGVGADLLGVDADPADEGVGVRGCSAEPGGDRCVGPSDGMTLTSSLGLQMTDHCRLADVGQK